MRAALPERRRLPLQPLAGIAGVAVLAYLIAVLNPLLSVAVLGAGAVAAALLRWPKLGVFLLIPAVPFQSLRTFNAGPFPVSITELLVAATLLAWLVRVALSRQQRFAPVPLLPPVLLFLAGIMLSFLPIVAAPPDKSSLIWGFKELVKWAELLITYLLAANLLRTRRDLAVAAALLLGSASADALIGLGQFVLRRGPPSFLIHGLFMRAYGTFDQPNPFAGYLNLSLVLALALALTFAHRPAGRWAAVAVLVLGAAVLASLSRGAWLALAVSIVLLLDRGGRRVRAVLGAGACVAILGAWLFAIHVAPASLTTKVSTALAISDVDVQHPTPATFSAAERLAFWIAGEQMFADHWLLGVGMGNYGFVYPRYALPGWDTGLAHAHDYYLNQAVETGVVGLGAYLIFVVAAFRCYWRPSGTLRDPFLRAIVLGTVGMLITLSVHNLLDDLYVHGTVVHIAILLAMAGLALRLDGQGRRASAESAGSGLPEQSPAG